MGARAADYFQFLIFADDKIRESLVNLYHFCSDYPGIRHPGTPANARRVLLRVARPLQGAGTAGLPAIFSHGFQMQASAMLVPKTLEFYLGVPRFMESTGFQRKTRSLKEKKVRKGNYERIFDEARKKGTLLGISAREVILITLERNWQFPDRNASFHCSRYLTT